MQILQMLIFNHLILLFRTDSSDLGLQIIVAVCIPKPCTIKQALPILIGTGLFENEEIYCRFKNDKPWAPGVYVAM